MLTSPVYRWASRRSDREIVARLNKGGYRVKRVTAVDARIAEAYPARWKKDHRLFNPADVPGL